MDVYRSLDAVPECIRPVLTIGNFDGVHRGHQEIFRRVVQRADEIGGTPMCLSFEPHPLKVLGDGRRQVRLLASREQKLRTLSAQGLEVCVLHPFTREFGAMDPGLFVDQYLRRGLGIEMLVIGHDYAMGRNRQGDRSYFERLHHQGHLQVEVVPPVEIQGQIVSSTLLRQLVSEGQVDAIPPYLGRLYQMSGRVVAGNRRGRTIGVPTANLCYVQEVVPLRGVYATFVQLGAHLWPSVTNIGYNPTFGGVADLRLETHILDFEADLYGKELDVHFVRRLRNEVRFDSREELILQIEQDKQQARRVLELHQEQEQHA